MLAVVFVARRLAGAFEGPVSAFAACSVGTLAAILSLLARGLFVSSGLKQVRPKEWGVAAITALPPFGLTLSLLPEQSAASVFFLTGSFASVFIAYSYVANRINFATLFQQQVHDPPHPANVEVPRFELPVVDQSSGHSPGGNELIQRINRTLSPMGQEQIDGTMVVFFEKGQKQAMLHIPFVPPLSETPSVNCEVLGGGEARLRKASVQPFGTRIEVKRSQAIDEPQWLEVGFSACTEKTQAEAA